MRLVIIRHGDPDYSIDSLTETGWKEAKLLVPRVEKLNAKAFYVSPLGRARDTAAVSLKALGREAEVKQWLREFAPRVQKSNDRKPKVAWDWLPEDWTKEPRFFDRDRWFEPEIFQNAGIEAEAKWVWQGLDEVLANHGYVREGDYYRAERPNKDTIVFFCHFGLECVLLSHLLNVSPMVLWHGTCAAPSSVTILNTEERREGNAYFRMACFGDTSHLYVADQEPMFHARFCEVFADFEEERDT